MIPTPDADTVARLMAPVVRVTRRCEVLNSDGTMYNDDVQIVTGNVNCDASRDERRTLDLTIVNADGTLYAGEGGLWYDKLIVPYRGIQWSGGSWEVPLGKFMIDSIEDVDKVRRRPRGTVNRIGPVAVPSPHDFANTLHITGRDLTKKMITETLDATLTYASGTSLYAIALAQIVNSGLTDYILPWTSSSVNPSPELSADQTFDANTTRLDVLKQCIQAFGYEFFVDCFGTAIVQQTADPATQTPVVTFGAGSDGNITNYKRMINDTELYNRVVVRGTGQNNSTVFAVAEVTDTSSPIHKSRIGTRTFPFDSELVPDNDSAAALASTLLAVHALESYEVDLGAIVMPWLDVGVVVGFQDPAPASAQEPISFFLSTLDIPLNLGEMSPVAKRVLPLT